MFAVIYMYMYAVMNKILGTSKSEDSENVACKSEFACVCVCVCVFFFFHLHNNNIIPTHMYFVKCSPQLSWNRISKNHIQIQRHKILS